jgi:hypothetical protein
MGIALLNPSYGAFATIVTEPEKYPSIAVIPAKAGIQLDLRRSA